MSAPAPLMFLLLSQYKPILFVSLVSLPSPSGVSPRPGAGAGPRLVGVLLGHAVQVVAELRHAVLAVLDAVEEVVQAQGGGAEALALPPRGLVRQI